MSPAIGKILTTAILAMIVGACAPEDPEPATQPDVLEAYLEYLGCWYELERSVNYGPGEFTTMVLGMSRRGGIDPDEEGLSSDYEEGWFGGISSTEELANGVFSDQVLASDRHDAAVMKLREALHDAGVVTDTFPTPDMFGTCPQDVL